MRHELTDDELAADWAGGISFALTSLQNEWGNDTATLDFSVTSLTALLDDFQSAYDTPAEAIIPEQRPDTQAAMAYLGETLLQVCNGRWGWDGQPGFAERGTPGIADRSVRAAITDTYWGWSGNPAGAPSGIPVLVPDPVLNLETVSPLHLILAAIDDGDGDPWRKRYEELATVVSDYAASHPEWVPEQTEIPPVGDCYSIPGPSPVLTAWLATREALLPQWSPGSGAWDFSPESLDRLDELICAHIANWEALDDPANRELVEGAVWYLGETLIRNGTSSGRPSRWVYRSWARKDGESGLVCFQVQANNNRTLTTPYYSLSSEKRTARRSFDRWNG